MAEERSLVSNPNLDSLLASFQDPHARVLLSLENGGGTLGHVEVAVHAIAWADHEERSQIEIRGLTSVGERYRASVDFARPERSGVVLDPDD